VREKVFDTRAVRIALYVAVLALAIRLIFLGFFPQLPVVWDSRLYICASLGLIGYCDRGGSFARGETSVEDFRHYYDTYLDGEDIDWLYYKAPTLSEAQKYLFYSGPTYPALMAVVFAFPWQNDFQAVRVVNALLDSIALGILALLAAAMFGNRTGLFTGLLLLLYIPAVITCGILSLETITSFFIALLLLTAFLHWRTEKNWFVYLAGLIAGVLFLTKPTAALLSVPLFVFYAAVYRKRKQYLVRSAMRYAFPFLLVVVPWIIFTSLFYGKLAMRDPEYAAANFRSSSIIEFEGYDLDYGEPDFWTFPVFQRIAEHPLGYINLMVKKLVRLWWTPHDEFWQGPKRLELIVHRAILILGLFALGFAPWRNSKFLYFPLAVLLYYTGIHVIFHAVPRYNFNAMPALFLLAGSVLPSEYFSRLSPKRTAILAGAGVVLLVLHSGLMGWYVPGVLPVMLMLIIALLLLASTAIFYVRALRIQFRSPLILAVGARPFLLFMLGSTSYWTRPERNGWQTRLDDDSTRLVTEIHLPGSFSIGPGESGKIVIDMLSDTTGHFPVQVDINGRRFSFYDGEPPMDRYYNIKGTYPAFDALMGLDSRQMHWYRTIPLSDQTIRELLGGQRVLNIALSIDNSGFPGAGITVFGDDHNIDQKTAVLPSFKRTSIERYKEFGDRRVYQLYHLESTSWKSYIMKSGEIIDDDLSSMPGRQHGRFRVYFITNHVDFTTHYY
jgi:4-amino-4-deoxy-L-arabinose transferase-like glycosyltransferase